MEESKHITTDNSLILSILLYGCEIWTLTEILERRITAFAHKAYRLYIKEYRGLPTEKEKQIIMYTK